MLRKWKTIKSARTEDEECRNVLGMSADLRHQKSFRAPVSYVSFEKEQVEAETEDALEQREWEHAKHNGSKERDQMDAGCST